MIVYYDEFVSYNTFSEFCIKPHKLNDDQFLGMSE